MLLSYLLFRDHSPYPLVRTFTILWGGNPCCLGRFFPRETRTSPIRDRNHLESDASPLIARRFV